MFRRSSFLISFLLCSSLLFAGGQIELLLPGILDYSSPLSYGFVYSYAAGTSTPKSIYSDADLTVAYDNPAELDVCGRLVAYGAGDYKFVFKNALNVTLFTVDNYVVLASSTWSNTDPFGSIFYQTEFVSDNIVADEIQVASITITSYAHIYAAVFEVSAFKATGDVDFNSYKGINLATGTDVMDAVNYGQFSASITQVIDYTDTQIASAIASITFPMARTLEVFTASQTWTVPSGVSSILVSISAGGGGGSGCGSGTTYFGGGGSAGGSWLWQSIAVTPGENLGFVVGLGGSAGTNGAEGVSGTTGGTGGDTRITRGVTILLEAFGGSGTNAGSGTASYSTDITDRLGEQPQALPIGGRQYGIGGNGAIRKDVIGVGITDIPAAAGGNGIIIVEY